MAKHWWSDSSAFIELEIEEGDVLYAAHQGDCENEVRDLQAAPYIKAQVDKLDPVTVSKVLKECGAWNEEELADKEMNIVRLLWVAVWDLKEEHCL